MSPLPLSSSALPIEPSALGIAWPKSVFCVRPAPAWHKPILGEKGCQLSLPEMRSRIWRVACSNLDWQLQCGRVALLITHFWLITRMKRHEKARCCESKQLTLPHGSIRSTRRSLRRSRDCFSCADSRWDPFTCFGQSHHHDVLGCWLEHWADSYMIHGN